VRPAYVGVQRSAAQLDVDERLGALHATGVLGGGNGSGRRFEQLRHLDRDELGAGSEQWRGRGRGSLRRHVHVQRRDRRTGAFDAATGAPLAHQIGVQAVREGYPRDRRARLIAGGQNFRGSVHFLMDTIISLGARLFKVPPRDAYCFPTHLPSKTFHTALQHWRSTMGSDQLIGRYSRLRPELLDAYAQQYWHGDHIDRLANELAQTERDIAAPAPRDEQCSDALPPLTA
jgi:hypothetical protein